MPLSVSPKKSTIFLGKNSKFTQEQNIALSKMPNTKTPEQLITENSAFVYHLVDKEFSIYYKTRGIGRDDLVSAGMMGLVIAANRSKYGTFLRYASFWIRYYIYKEIRECGLIRRPASFCGVLNKIRRFQESYKYDHGGEEPPMEWLVKKTGFSEKVISETLDLDERNATTVVSIESLKGEDGDGSSVYDRLASDGGRSAERGMIRTDLKEAIDRRLMESEKRIVTMHYYEGLTVCEIAEREGGKIQVINQILKNALGKLREEIGER